MQQHDAAIEEKSWHDGHALIGHLSKDDFCFKDSPDGSAYVDAIRIDQVGGRPELPEPVLLLGRATPPVDSQDHAARRSVAKYRDQATVGPICVCPSNASSPISGSSDVIFSSDLPDRKKLNSIKR